MNYHRSNIRRERRIGLYILAIAIALLLLYQNKIVIGFFGGVTTGVTPLLEGGKNIREGVGEGLLSVLSFKASLVAENEGLRNKLVGFQTKLLENDRLVKENAELKLLLGRKEKEKLLLANVMAKPDQSPYDTIILDVGNNYDVEVGDKVLVSGSTIIGEIKEVGAKASKAVLLTSYGEESGGTVFGKNISLKLVGRGGGNFIAELPRGVSIERGEQIISDGIFPHTLGIVDSIFSDARSPFQGILVKSPVNVQTLRFVEIIL